MFVQSLLQLCEPLEAVGENLGYSLRLISFSWATGGGGGGGRGRVIGAQELSLVLPEPQHSKLKNVWIIRIFK